MYETRRGFLKWINLLFGSRVGSVSAVAVAEQAAGRVAPGSSESPVVDRADCRSAAERDEKPIQRNYDLVIVGGGIAGTSAAISAARHGVQVALVHNRPMLGGNSSSEVKLYPENAPGHQPWIKEGGIYDEIHTEDRVRNHRE